jgi:replicative DNA helicase
MSRPLPQSQDAEELLLGCCFVDTRVMTKAIAGGIAPASFMEAKNVTLFGTCMGLHADNRPITIDVVAEELKRVGKLDDVGGYPYLAQVSSRCPTTAEADYFIAQVRSYAIRRALIRNAMALAESCYDYAGDNMQADMGRHIEQMGEHLHRREESKSWVEVVEEAKQLALARISGTDGAATQAIELTWGFNDLDRCFQRMEIGELVVLAARTSSGKSSLMRQIVLANAFNGHPVLLESMEVTDTEAATNMAANVSGIRSRKDLNQLHKKDQNDLIAGFDKLKMKHMSVCHSDHSLSEIKARALAFKSKHGLRLLAVDFLGLVSDARYPMKGERIDQAIGRVTGDLKQFAVREGIVVLLLVQLNRSSEKDNNRQPLLSDLRDSGRIEEDANRVIFLHRPTEYTLGGASRKQDFNADVENEPRFYIECIQAKGRNHGTGMVGLSFDRQTATFRQLNRN